MGAVGARGEPGDIESWHPSAHEASGSSARVADCGPAKNCVECRNARDLKRKRGCGNSMDSISASNCPFVRTPVRVCHGRQPHTNKSLSWYIVPSARAAMRLRESPEKRRPRHRGCGKSVTGSNTPRQPGNTA
jgi:hypothetical protein